MAIPSLSLDVQLSLYDHESLDSVLALAAHAEDCGFALVSVGGERLDALVREPPSGERVGVRLPPDKLITVRELGQ